MNVTARPAGPPAELTELHNGDHLTQPEFHRIYGRMRRFVRAELVGGVVYMASPLQLRHATNHLPFGMLLLTYEAYTPGTQSGDNGTVVLGAEDEYQPDLFLRVLPEHGGQSRTTPDDYVEGAPELIAEIAHSSRAIDLNAKRDGYTRGGVREYLVLDLRDDRLRWFDLQAGQELAADADGICRVHTFPGLWIDGAALLARDIPRMLASLNAGLATAEHAAFVQALSAHRSG